MITLLHFGVSESSLPPTPSLAKLKKHKGPQISSQGQEPENFSL